MIASAFNHNPLMSVLHGFAQTSARMSEMTEREVHPVGDRPVGDGWVCIRNDGIDAVWERTRLVRAAS